MARQGPLWGIKSGPMKALIAVVASALTLSASALAQGQPDPFQGLEDIDAPSSMSWVAGQNAKSAKRLESDPRYEVFRQEARTVFTAQDRIPWPEFRAQGIDNLWQDAAHIHGIWRHTSLVSYRATEPTWDTLLDLDTMSKAEGKNWFLKGATCLKPVETRCLLSLSNGGGDAVEIREFDTVTRAFVADGFQFSAGKQSVAWLDADTVIAAREWTPGEVTASGYPYVVRTVGRNGGGRELYRGAKTDVSSSAQVLYGPGGKVDGAVFRRGVDFFRSEFSLWAGGKTARIALPLKAQFNAYVNGRMVFTLKEAWSGYGVGSVVAYKLAAFGATPELIFTPSPHQSVQAVNATAGKVVVTLLDEVKGAVDVYDLAGGRWVGSRLDLPKDATLRVDATETVEDNVFVSAEGFLDPTSLWLADAATGITTRVKVLPPRFDATKHTVNQYRATSSDGTKIPYFVVAPKTTKLDGSTPTFMYGYGGFEVAKPPIYLPEMGKIWLERGGAYVIANIRGGGEFGPAWHEAVMRENRQLAFDDFAAVARDLTARGIASPRRLGIYGRSNGGVLTTVSMTQHPELWNAVVVESPLIDMLRYHKLSAGASWIGEYGDPDVPSDAAFIGMYSAYQNLKPGVIYPEAYITTNTRDDRVHPGHARKFAAKLEAMGVPYLYYEQTFGGHANDADPELNAGRWARHYVYLAQKLMD